MERRGFVANCIRQAREQWWRFAPPTKPLWSRSRSLFDCPEGCLFSFSLDCPEGCLFGFFSDFPEGFLFGFFSDCPEGCLFGFFSDFPEGFLFRLPRGVFHRQARVHLFFFQQRLILQLLLPVDCHEWLRLCLDCHEWNTRVVRKAEAHHTLTDSRWRKLPRGAIRWRRSRPCVLPP